MPFRPRRAPAGDGGQRGDKARDTAACRIIPRRETLLGTPYATVAMDDTPCRIRLKNRYMAGGWGYWAWLKRGLPAEGVLKRFATEEICRARLVEVRWLDGPCCLRCCSTDVTLLATRPAYQCQNCRYQFTVTVGTALHRSRLPLLEWFSGAEEVIKYQARSDLVMPSELLAEQLGISYAAAWRLRDRICEDCAPEGAGLLRRAVCIEHDETAP